MSKNIFILFLGSLVLSGFFAAPVSAQYYYGGNYPYHNYSGNLPILGSVTATNISNHSALLTAWVNPNRIQTTVWFEYGASFGLGTTIGSQSVGNGSSPVNIAVPLNNLQPQTTYYYRLVATNSYGTQTSQIGTFQTLSGSEGSVRAPEAETQGADQIGTSSAILHGLVRPNRGDTNVWFEYGRTSSLGLVSPRKLISGINDAVTINLHLSSISPGTSYSYRLVAENASGRSAGSIRTFSTLPGERISTSTPPRPATSTPPVPSTPESPALSLLVQVSSPEIAAGSEFDYSATYRNSSDRALRDAVLTVQLPAEMEFLTASEGVPNLQDGAVVFSPDTINERAEKAITLRLRLDSNTEPGRTLPIQSVLSYTSPQGRPQTATSNLTILTKASTGGPANVYSNLSGLSWLRWILIGLGIVLIAGALYIAIRLIRSHMSLNPEAD